MDPATVIGIASGSAALAELLGKSVLNLASFIKNNRSVGETVQGLHDEVQGLQNILSTIDSTVRKPEILSSRQLLFGYHGVWQQLKASVEQCEDVATKLSQGVQRIGNIPVDTNVVTRIAVQIRLSLKEDQMRDLRMQAQAHKLNIQMALQMLTLACSAESPTATRDLLTEPLNELMRLLVAVHGMVIQTNMEQQQLTALTKQALQGSHQLMRNAQQTLSVSASVAFDTSKDDDVMSSILSDFHASNPLVTNAIQRWIDETESVAFESTSDIDAKITPEVSAQPVDKVVLQPPSNTPASLTPQLNGLCIAPEMRSRDQKHMMDTLLSRGYVSEDDVEHLDRFFGRPTFEWPRGAMLSDALFKACRDGDQDMVSLLLRNEVDPNSIPSWKQGTVLIETAKRNHTNCAILLLDYGANTEATTEKPVDICGPKRHVENSDIHNAPYGLVFNSRFRALAFAAACGHLEMVEVLVGRHANVQQSSAREASPLFLATYFRHPKVVQRLLLAGASTTSFTVPKQIQGNQFKYLFKYGVNEESQVNVAYLAASRNDLQMLSAIYDAFEGSQPDFTRNVRNGDYNCDNSSDMVTILHLAANEQSSAEVVKYLISKGLSKDAVDSKGRTCLHCNVGARSFHPHPTEGLETSEMLLSLGFDVNARDRYQRTPLHHFAFRARLNSIYPSICLSNGKDMRDRLTKFMQILIQNGAEVNARDEFGNTPLHIVSQAICGLDSETDFLLRLIHILLSQGADKSICNNSGYDVSKNANLSWQSLSEKELPRSSALKAFADKLEEVLNRFN